MRPHIPVQVEGTIWTSRAACRDHEPALFFPSPGADERPALAICAGCEVRSDCLGYALSAGERYGIWGGTTQRHRRRMLKRARWSRPA